VTLPMTMMQIGIVWVLTAPSKAVKLPIVESMMEPTTISRMPPATNIRLSKYSRYLNIEDRQFMVLFFFGFLVGSLDNPFVRSDDFRITELAFWQNPAIKAYSKYSSYRVLSYLSHKVLYVLALEALFPMYLNKSFS